MPLITIILALVVVGVILWLIDAYIPMDPMIKRIIQIVIICVIVIWLLKITGLWAALSTIHV